jgi:hypothetical protein
VISRVRLAETPHLQATPPFFLQLPRRDAGKATWNTLSVIAELNSEIVLTLLVGERAGHEYGLEQQRG